MVDLRGQYLKIKEEIDAAMQQVIDSTSFIGGEAVRRFAGSLSAYLGGADVVTCANGTDALQVALMGLGLERGDEVVVPAFTYVASAEVIALLGLRPVLVDVDPHTFNTTAALVERALSPRTRAVVVVHLFGQSADMEPLLRLASEHGLAVVEDNAQSLGGSYRFADGRVASTGTMGTVGCTSFFPSKNLGCYGDGGAMTTHDPLLAARLKMIANHGQREKYRHEVVGCNSRLDALQAAVLDVKLRHLDEYCAARREAARRYNERLLAVDPSAAHFTLPAEAGYARHVYHQYTITVGGGRRDALREYLASRGIPSMVYYPLPLHMQPAFAPICRVAGPLAESERLAGSVLSLPMHTELTESQQDRVAEAIADFYKHNP